MPRYERENPPGHEGAPEGEIRQEPLPTLRNFSIFIAAAVALPAIALLVGGFSTGYTWVGVAGVILLVCLGGFFFVTNFEIMRSRKIHPAERAREEGAG
ncbi:MAG TPA: hypothetical protein VJ728_14800 [Candidatus Binataceae bacterium]|nr:hypothetical protein [Candidatus Binataceae bacterium]